MKLEFFASFCLFTACLFTALLFAPLMKAQTQSATVSGTVFDASGAVVQNASIQAELAETGAKRSTNSGVSGVYSLTGLRIGKYRIAIQAPGFQNFVVESLTLQVGQNATLDAHLQVGTAQTSTTVTDDSPLDQVTAAVGGVVSGGQVRDLPINGRNWSSLMTQTPGAIDSGTDNQRSIRFAGHGLDDNNFRFDGVDATGIFNQAEKGTFRLQFSTEAIAEFRANAALYTAESGGTQGGQVDVVSRSGTNTFHGSLFEYLRNDATDARGPFDGASLPPFRLNQFGGSFGGPVRKNKDFFFTTYEGLRQRVGQTLIGFVPSASFRTTVLAASPSLASVLNAYPAGTSATSDPNVSRYTGPGHQSTNEDSGLLRYDHKFSDAWNFSLRYNADAGISELPNGVLFDRTATTLATHNVLLSLTTVISARTLNDFRAGFNRAAFATQNKSVYGTEILSPQFSTLYNNTGKIQNSNAFDYRDTLSTIRGRHTLKAGLEIRRLQVNATATSSNDYELTYSSTPNFLNNILSQASLVNTLPSTGLRRTEYSAFFQDEFRVTSTLTANLGVRYEYFGVPHDIAGRGIVFDPFSCAGGYCPAGTSFYKGDFNNFSPRIGLAWAPAALHNRLVVRSGYGIFYGDGQIGDLTAPLDNLAGRALLTSSNTPGLSFPVDPSAATSAFAPAAPRSLDRNRVTPYTEEWGLSVQTAITKNTVFTAGYLGESGAHQFTRSYLNALNPVTRLAPYPQFGLIDYKTTSSNNNFNGLQLSLQRNLGGNFEASLNYLYSHAISDGSTGGGETDYPENVACRACERASSDYDIRHYLSGNMVYKLPFGKGQKYVSRPGVLYSLVGGWNWANILAARTGLPVNVTISRAASAVPDGNTSSPQRPNVVAGQSVVPSNQSIAEFISPAAYSIPAPGTFGNAGRNSARGPDNWQIDTALFRNIQLTERFRLVVRAEAFNLTNHPQYALPSGNFSNLASFGLITAGRNATGIGTGTPREFEFALRLEF